MPSLAEFSEKSCLYCRSVYVTIVSFLTGDSDQVVMVNMYGVSRDFSMEVPSHPQA